MNSLQYIGSDWPLTVKFSNDPVRAFWRELIRYSGRERARQAFKQHHGDQTYLHRFANLNTLADSYFTSYEDANEMLDCLLLYYGAMTLGLAVSYLTLPSDVMTTRSETHGIESKIDLTQPQPFLRAKLHVTEAAGTFNLINRSFGGDDLHGRTFELIDFLRAIPDLDESLLSVTGTGTTAIVFKQLWHEARQKQAPFKVELDRTFNSLDHLLSKVVISDYLRGQNALLDGRRLTWDRRRTIAKEETATIVTAGVKRFLFPKISGAKISEYAVYLGVLHCLSTLCRYHPDIWVPMIDEGSDEHYIVREFVQTAEEKIPQLALNHYGKSTFAFHTKMAFHIPAVQD